MPIAGKETALLALKLVASVMEKVVKLFGTLLSLVFSLVLITTPSIAAGNTNPGKPAPKAKPAPKVIPPKLAPKVDVKPAPKKPAPNKIAKPTPKKKSAPPLAKATKNTKKQPKPKVVKIRAKGIYLGRYKGFRKAAVLDTQKVFKAISYYQELKRAGLTKKSGRYWILLQKSNRIFYKALRQMAKKQGYDLIGARKSILIDGSSPVDLTEKLVRIIPSIQLY